MRKTIKSRLEAVSVILVPDYIEELEDSKKNDLSFCSREQAFKQFGDIDLALNIQSPQSDVNEIFSKWNYFFKSNISTIILNRKGDVLEKGFISKNALKSLKPSILNGKLVLTAFILLYISIIIASLILPFNFMLGGIYYAFMVLSMIAMVVISVDRRMDSCRIFEENKLLNRLLNALGIVVSAALVLTLYFTYMHQALNSLTGTYSGKAGVVLYFIFCGLCTLLTIFTTLDKWRFKNNFFSLLS